jgi:hypothetical protein
MKAISTESTGTGTNEAFLPAAERALTNLVIKSRKRPYTRFELLLLLLGTSVGRQITSDEVLARCVLNVVAREGLIVAGA